MKGSELFDGLAAKPDHAAWSVRASHADKREPFAEILRPSQMVGGEIGAIGDAFDPV